MKVRKFGYIRTTKDQKEQSYVNVFREKLIDERDIFIDKQIGNDFNRVQYQLLKGRLRKDDVVYLHSLNCLGGNKQEILNEWTYITMEVQADIVVLNMHLVDTTQFKDSLKTLIADLVIQILSWTVNEERERTQKHHRAGIERTLQNGSSFGRPKVKITEEFKQVYKRWKTGEIKAVKAMQEIGVKKTTFYKLVKEYENS